MQLLAVLAALAAAAAAAAAAGAAAPAAAVAVQRGGGPVVVLPCGAKIQGAQQPVTVYSAAAAGGDRVDDGDSVDDDDAVATSTTLVDAFWALPYARTARRFGRPKDASCAETLAPAFDARVNDNIACWNSPPGPAALMANQTEDCLVLSVFRPSSSASSSSASASKPKRVFFWVYGGSNIQGGATIQYAAWSLAALEDVVVVAANYRLGLFASLATSELTRENGDGASGNNGIADLTSALRWVKANIAGFGGDPEQVTLYGQSSGGTNINQLLHAPAAKGLFHGAITMSASYNVTMTLAHAEKQNEQLLPRTPGIRCSDLACLRAIPAEQLANASSYLFGMASPSSYPTRAFGPAIPQFGLSIIDGVIVTASATSPPLDPSVPVLSSVLSHDMLLFEYGLGAPPPARTTADFVAQLRDAMETRPDGWPAANASEVAGYYSSATDGPAAAEARFLTQMLMVTGLLDSAPGPSEPNADRIYQLMNRAGVLNPSGVPNPFYPPAPFKHNFHIWDYILGVQWFAFGEALGTGSYVPKPGDLKAGAELRRLWMAVSQGNIGSLACSAKEQCINTLDPDAVLRTASTNTALPPSSVAPEVLYNHVLRRNSLGDRVWWWCN